jgi:hypothetical protein
MVKKTKIRAVNGSSLLETSFSGLRGKQSVRATFKLSEKAIDAISVVSVHLGIKQKSLFDHLLEEAEALDLIAQEIQSSEYNPPNRVRKTYVLSRRTIQSLENACRIFDTPRDALVEYSIQRLLPLIEREREKHRKRKAILDDLKEYLAKGDEILRKTKRSLGEDDPAYDRMESAMIGLVNAHDDIKAFVEKGNIIEDF